MKLVNKGFAYTWIYSLLVAWFLWSYFTSDMPYYEAHRYYVFLGLGLGYTFSSHLFFSRNRADREARSYVYLLSITFFIPYINVMSVIIFTAVVAIALSIIITLAIIFEGLPILFEKMGEKISK